MSFTTRSARTDAAVCARTLRQGSRSFAAAALLLPPGSRRHARALYGFCRVADDLIDGAPPHARTGVIAALRTRLDRACAATPDDTPIDRAFAAALTACAIPRALPEALLEGFAWDAEGRRYADLPALRAYAARVAGTVGAMVSLVLGARDPAALARACDLGVAMQLSNIARDVGEDARSGRLYLPLEWLHAEGVDPAHWMQEPVFSPAIGAVTARLLAEAESLYARAEAGIALLPLACRPAIRAAARLYREIGREVLRSGPDAISVRAVVPRARKLLLMPGCLFGSPASSAARQPEPLAEAAFLLHAVPRTTAIARENAVIRVLRLFAELEQREQLRSPG